MTARCSNQSTYVPHGGRSHGPTFDILLMLDKHVYRLTLEPDPQSS